MASTGFEGSGTPQTRIRIGRHPGEEGFLIFKSMSDSLAMILKLIFFLLFLAPPIHWQKNVNQLQFVQVT